jgi:hypothetical protein
MDNNHIYTHASGTGWVSSSAAAGSVPRFRGEKPSFTAQHPGTTGVKTVMCACISFAGPIFFLGVELRERSCVQHARGWFVTPTCACHDGTFLSPQRLLQAAMPCGRA